MGLEVMIVILCLHFGRRGWGELHANLSAIHKEFELPELPTDAEDGGRSSLWWETASLKPGRGQEWAAGERVNLAALWNEYLVRLRLRNRVVRSLPMAILAFLACNVFVLVYPPALAPVRGHVEFQVIRITFLLCTLLCTWLAFVCVDAIRLQRDFIRFLTQRTTAWPQRAKDLSLRSSFLSEQALAEYLDIRLIATRSEPVSWFIHFPFITSSLLVAALSSYFDDWSWPAGVLALFGLNFGCVLFSAVTLARAAEAARRHALAVLRRERLREFQTDDDTLKTRLEVYDQTIQEVEALRKGALAPLWEQPLVQAVLYSTGSLGLGSLLQFLPGQ
jgi:hypothetical protein